MWREGKVFWWPAGAEEELVSWSPGPHPEPARTLEILSPPLPAVWAEGLARRLSPWAGDLRGLRRRLARHLRELRARGWALAQPSFHPLSQGNEGGDWKDEELLLLTAGRRLLLSEIYRRALRWRRLPFGDQRPPGELVRLSAALFRLQQAGRGRIEPGILWDRGEVLRCGRCGGQEVTAWPCHRCGTLCPECETCRTLGVVRGCDVIFEGYGGRPEGTRAPFPSRAGAYPAPPLALSPAQEGAAAALLEFLAGPRREALLWAACGAGKTEVAFAAVRAVLERGGRVLFTVPRRDVVAELGQRLARYAHPFRVEVAYGGAPSAPPGASSSSRDLAPLVVATTHQCLRLGTGFDLIVLDEVDAYPYRVEPFLQRAVRRALAEQGKFITMTATPEGAHLRRARWGQVSLITIPARHHGHPLPVPRWVRDRSPHPETPGSAARDVMERCLQEGPTLVFVPTVSLSRTVGEALHRHPLPCQAQKGWKVGWVHSRDPARDEKIAAFREGSLRLLVATTVLERGITVPGVQVVVLWADYEPVFDERTLVQMAGRAGRSAAHPAGDVYFVSRRRTRAMVTAVAQIRMLNRWARQRGYLDGGGESGPSRPPSREEGRTPFPLSRSS